MERNRRRKRGVKILSVEDHYTKGLFCDRCVTNIGGQDWQMYEQINREIARYLNEDKDN